MWRDGHWVLHHDSMMEMCKICGHTNSIFTPRPHRTWLPATSSSSPSGRVVGMTPGKEIYGCGGLHLIS
ncbi:Hypothetical protein SMAX5B_000217 [Scophthalmus maximus]|uniref:Uncharacterized protein n=1 Tax=Scophthalmus maximus TaxID=52904 RepID=A0A2U9CWT2_SCOMX|nr:Hypothetical protein SMAX5B_000217 [Scophthalmus maximus]